MGHMRMQLEHMKAETKEVEAKAKQMEKATTKLNARVDEVTRAVETAKVGAAAPTQPRAMRMRPSDPGPTGVLRRRPWPSWRLTRHSTRRC
jgi:hypothetical protein